MTQTTKANKIWPRAYLLELYNRAIRDGCIRVGPLTHPAAKSLTQAFYRLRRRADTNTATWITPEFQLCTVSQWAEHIDHVEGPSPGEHRGFIYIMFDRLPEGESLPNVESVEPDDAIPHFHPTSSDTNDLEVPEEDRLALVDWKTEDIDVDSFVNKLRKDAAKGAE